MSEDSPDIIDEIVKKYPEKEWMTRCHEALPDWDDESLLAYIEICCGGDCVAIEDVES